MLFRPANLMSAFLKLTRHDRRPEEPEGPQRLVPCAQARWLGHGTIELAARAPGTSRKTMAAGAAEPEAGGSAGISCWRCDTESRKRHRPAPNSRALSYFATPRDLIRAMPAKGDHPAGRFF